MIEIEIILNKSNSLGYPSPELVLHLFNLNVPYIKISKMEQNSKELTKELENFDVFQRGYLADFRRGILYKNYEFIYIDPDKFDNFRVCKEAIRLVKEMGQDASSEFSKLVVRKLKLDVLFINGYEEINQELKDGI